MRVVRGRDRTPAADGQRSRELRDWVEREREPAVRVWRPHRQVAFGRRDANAAGFDRAKAAARDRGFAPVERDVGGRAVAYTGSTIAFARIEPLSDPRTGMDARYEAMVEDVQAALTEVGVDTKPGEPPRSFCPGDHSLQHRGKLAGIAQRVTAEAALVSGVVIVDQHEEIADVLQPVYEALQVPFDPSTVGSVARSGGDVESVRETLESVLVGSSPVQVETIRSG